jgi:hypothetical protein
MSTPSAKDHSRLLDVPGPGGQTVHLVWDEEWLGVSTKLPIPLYVGRGLISRIGWESI